MRLHTIFATMMITGSALFTLVVLGAFASSRCHWNSQNDAAPGDSGFYCGRD